MADASKSLRWYGAFAVILLGFGPAALLSALVIGGHAARAVAFPLIAGIALVITAAVYVVRGITGTDPQEAARHLHLSLALVAGADLLMLGGNALIHMSSS